MCSSTPVREPKLQLAVEPSTGGHWNSPTKDTPRPKIKKLQQDDRRGTISIKANPILAVWVTHKLENKNTKEVKVPSHC